MKGVPIDVIRKLARIVTTENVFIDEKKYHRKVIRGVMRSQFTLIVPNIFMWKWETELFRQQEVSK